MQHLRSAGWLLAAAVAAALPGTGPTAQEAEPPGVLVVEDFETASLGALPFLWRSAVPVGTKATIGAERLALGGVAANKALKFEYEFPAGMEAPALAAGPGLRDPAGQGLPGSLTGLTMAVFGDNSRNSVGVVWKDAQGESFEARLPVTWAGWQTHGFSLAAARPLPGVGATGNGRPDAPFSLQSVRVVREAQGARKGEISVDNLVAECRFGRVSVLFDSTRAGDRGGWRANKLRAVVGAVGDTTVPRQGRDVTVLKLEYAYENASDSSVEYQKIIPAGDGHGTLVAEVFGDGSNNVLRFRMLDGQDRVWQATWAGILVDWSGWRTLYVDTRSLRAPDAADPSAVLRQFPVRFQGIVIDDASPSDRLPGVESGRAGEIFLGRLLFAAEG